jgi:hypothetical protein
MRPDCFAANATNPIPVNIRMMGEGSGTGFRFDCDGGL